MRATRAFLLLAMAAMISAVPLASDPAAWKGLTPAQVEQVKKGQIVLMDQDTSGSGDQKRFIQAAILFNQPIDKAWQLFRKTENQHRYLPDLDECKLVKRDAKGDLVDFEVELAGFEIEYRIHHVYDDANYKLSWGLDPSYDNDMKRVDGFWHLYKYSETQTLARYGTQVEVSSLIPEFIMKKLTRDNLPANMQAVKKYIESGGKWTKPGFDD